MLACIDGGLICIPAAIAWFLGVVGLGLVVKCVRCVKKWCGRGDCGCECHEDETTPTDDK